MEVAGKKYIKCCTSLTSFLINFMVRTRTEIVYKSMDTGVYDNMVVHFSNEIFKRHAASPNASHKLIRKNLRTSYIYMMVRN